MIESFLDLLDTLLQKVVNECFVCFLFELGAGEPLCWTNINDWLVRKVGPLGRIVCTLLLPQLCAYLNPPGLKVIAFDLKGAKERVLFDHFQKNNYVARLVVEVLGHDESLERKQAQRYSLLMASVLHDVPPEAPGLAQAWNLLALNLENKEPGRLVDALDQLMLLKIQKLIVIRTHDLILLKLAHALTVLLLVNLLFSSFQLLMNHLLKQFLLLQLPVQLVIGIVLQTSLDLVGHEIIQAFIWYQSGILHC